MSTDTSRPSNVIALPSRVVAATPTVDLALVKVLEAALADARTGKLTAILGTGLTNTGERYVVKAGSAGNVEQVIEDLGSLAKEVIDEVREKRLHL